MELGFGTLPTAVTAGNQATATVALEDDDGAALQVSFGASTYTAIENGAAVTVTVSLDATSDRALTIPITTDPTSGDFSLSSTSLTFASGDQSKTFTVTASEDADLDDDTVELGFGTLPTAVTAGNQATATVALEDDDGAALQVSFGASTYTAIENGAAVTVTVSLDATSDRALTIPITTDPTKRRLFSVGHQFDLRQRRSEQGVHGERERGCGPRRRDGDAELRHLADGRHRRHAVVGGGDAGGRRRRRGGVDGDLREVDLHGDRERRRSGGDGGSGQDVGPGADHPDQPLAVDRRLQRIVHQPELRGRRQDQDDHGDRERGCGPGRRDGDAELRHPADGRHGRHAVVGDGDARRRRRRRGGVDGDLREVDLHGDRERRRRGGDGGSGQDVGPGADHPDQPLAVDRRLQRIVDQPELRGRRQDQDDHGDRERGCGPRRRDGDAELRHPADGRHRRHAVVGGGDAGGRRRRRGGVDGDLREVDLHGDRERRRRLGDGGSGQDVGPGADHPDQPLAVDRGLQRIVHQPELRGRRSDQDDHGDRERGCGPRRRDGDAELRHPADGRHRPARRRRRR